MIMCNFLAVTPSAWFITCLGFGLVFLLLLFFVCVIVFMGFIMKPENCNQCNSSKSKTVTSHAQACDQDNQVSVAIATTLYLYFNTCMHDVEPTKITLVPHPTQWNNKMYGMNNLHR